MLFILAQSSVWAFTRTWTAQESHSKNESDAKLAVGVVEPEMANIVMQLALMQAILGSMTLLNAHVQIITRISSGYPLWYLWLALAISGEEKSSLALSRAIRPGTIVRWMVLYGVIQAGLFASFLPPA